MLSSNGQQVQGWITSDSVLHAVAREISGPPPQAAPAGPAAGAQPGQESSRPEPPDPLPGYQVLEVTIEDGSPASGQALGAITWPPGTFPVSILHDRSLQDADPRLRLAPGDRINLLARAPQHPAPQLPHGNPDGRPHIADRH